MLALLSAAASLAAAGGLRHLIGRIRPSDLGADPSRFDPLAFDDRLAAMPSAPAACIAAISLSLAVSLPRLRLPLVVAAAAAGLACLLAGAPWPNDGMAGWGLGAAMAIVAQVGHARRHRRAGCRCP